MTITLPRRGPPAAVSIYAGVCVVGLLSLAAYARPQLPHCLAYGAAGALLMYLANRFLIRRLNAFGAQPFAAVGMLRLGPVLLVSAIALFGFFETMASGRPNGWMYLAFILLGGELGEYHKLRARERRARG